MSPKPAEKIIEALTQLIQGYSELQESVQAEFGSKLLTEDEEAESELDREVDAAIVLEMRTAIESVMESEDYAAEEVAAVVSTVTDALEEIEPDVFAEEEDEDDDEDEEEDEDIDFDDEEEEEDDEDDED